MAKGNDYRIKKIEKGPLQRFKSQNLLLKKFGETGIQVYKAITGKRSTQELKKDLGIEDSLFDQIISYMHDSGMVELEPISGEPARKPSALEPEPVEEKEPEEPPQEEKSLEELPPAEETEEGAPPLEEKPARKKVKKPEEVMTFEEITPIDIEAETPASEEREGKIRPSARRKKRVEESTEVSEEISPVGEEPEEEAQPPSEEAPPEEAPPEETSEEPEEEPEKEEAGKEEEEISISAFEEEKPREENENEMSPVEKIIFEKYGDLGLRAYSLIDGQRTAEEIMRETGLTEAKLVEMLDFMDEQGIIKLDYPKGQAPSGPSATAFSSQPQQQVSEPAKKEEGGFGPMIEGEDSLDEAKAIISPVETPIKAPLDIAKSVQMKVKIMLKYGDKGAKISESADGKNDVLDISLKLNMPLYEVYDILRFMMESGMILMKPMSRADVRKKYGDDGYAVYKRYGKEGLMLYELIGKEMTIQQMADKITKDKAKIIDMFIFIHKVLGIE